jgi:hypothetical protein
MIAMRSALAAIALVMLAACDSGGAPATEASPGDTAAVGEVDEGLIALHGEGVVVGAESFFFAAGRTEVDTALAKVLGEPLERLENTECGAGPMEFTTYPGGLTVGFQDGSLAGWLLREGGETGADAIAVDAAVAIGAPAEEIVSVPGYEAVEGSTLGEEFLLESGIGGFVEDGTVSMLYAGTQCFFR